MELLVFLADHSGQVVSRQQILDGVWRQEFVSDATVSGTIAKLRRALGDDAKSPRYIGTVPGITTSQLQLAVGLAFVLHRVIQTRQSLRNA